MDNIIVSPGDKIKLLRKEYDIKQEDLSVNGLKRTTLSMIETGKNGLTQKTGELVVKNFNEILTKKGIDLKINLEDLIETLDSQIESKLKEYLKELDEDDSRLDFILSEMNYYRYLSRSRELSFYVSKKIGDIYFKKEKYFESIIAYTNIFDYLIELEISDKEVLSNTIFNCLASYFYLRKYKESLNLYRTVEQIEDSLDFSGKVLIFKLYLCTKMELGEYADCIKEINEKFIGVKLDSMTQLELEMIELECNIELENYYTAQLILKKIKKEKDEKIQIYASLKEGILHKNTNNFIKLKKLVNVLRDSIDLEDETCIYKKELYYDFALCLLGIDEFKEAEKYLLKSLNIYNSKNYLAANLLINLYLEKKLTKGILNITEITLKFIKWNYLKKNDEIILKLIYAMNKLNLSLEISSLIEKLV